MLKGKRSVTPSRGNPSNGPANDSNKNNNSKKVSVMSQQSENTHWNEIVQETVLSATNPDQLYFSLIGGADEGQFPHIGDILHSPEDVEVSVRGQGLNIGDVLLEIQGQKVSGFTGQDVQEVLKQCLTNGRMVVVRSVPKGRTLFQSISNINKMKKCYKLGTKIYLSCCSKLERPKLNVCPW